MSPNVGDRVVEPDRYALGVVQDASLHFAHQLTKAEWARLDEAILAVNRLDPPFHYKLIERNFLQLKDVHQFVTITISLGGEFASGDHRPLGESVMTATVNWLTAMRMFLDHEETELNRRFGKTSSEFRAFKKATSAAYNGEVGYRFAYQFRNYVQHCGLPLAHITVQPPSAANPLMKQAATLLLDREVLLNAFKDWKKVKVDIEAMPPTFELLPLLEGAMTGIRAVNRACLEIDLDEALAKVPTVAAALDRLEDVKGEPTLFRYARNEMGGFRIVPQAMQARAVRTLCAVAEGTASRESLWAVNDREPAPLPLDPTAVREMFHRDSRGVQIITAWLQEGGGTPRFFDLVNQFIRDDKGIEPVLTGLINTTTMFAHITAGALGTTAEALIAGVLDRYSHIDLSPSDETQD
jgi:hypothetical protein